MSRRDSIRAAVRAKKLFCLPPLIRGIASVRTVFVSEEVFDNVHPPWPPNRDGDRLAKFRATLDAFTAGEIISVAETPRKKPVYTSLARVEPIDADIWDIRVVAPSPGIRCLGAFSERDTFVVLTWDYRENLQNDADWAAEIKRCQEAWERLFSPDPPLHGATLYDYLSGNFYVV